MYWPNQNSRLIIQKKMKKIERFIYLLLITGQAENCTVKTNVLPQHIMQHLPSGLKIGGYLCAIIAHIFVL